MAAQQTAVSITLFGTGCTIVCGTIHNDYWKKIQQELVNNKVTIEQFMSSQNDLRYMDLQGLKTWKDISNEFSLTGMTDAPNSSVQLKIGDSKKTNIPLREISRQEVLFPVYTAVRESKTLVSESIYHAKRLILTETEVGKIGTIKFKASDFSIDKLVFHITDVKVNESVSYTVLGKITYAGKTLCSVNPDTLIMGFYCLA